ncbi:MAG: hypothetical protein JSV04_14335 [Candidatus Heimdallarchaeota archaeon]|nr:MAG: hypothetical protein JSV04_14335 [Candidatus Heimdallarchaeota archaeon]
MKCERCEIDSASLFCLRCKRAICGKCYEDSLGLCSDCVNFKKATEWDRRQLVRILTETVRISTNNLEKQKCHACEILRYHLLFTLKVLKNLGIELEHEDLTGLRAPVHQLRDAVIPLIIEAISQKKLAADPTSWPRI